MDFVPVIDLGAAGPPPLRALDRACREWGFFQITGHGVEPGLRRELLAQTRRFFALPMERKRVVERSARNTWGFFDRELTKNSRDWKQVFDVGPPGTRGPLAGSVPQRPRDLPGFRPALEAFAAACERVAYRLLALVALNLGQPAGALARGGAADGRPDRQHRGRRAGLVQRRLSGARPPGGREGRARALQRALLIFNPAYAADYAPLSAPPRYRPINWGEFRAGRAAGDYADRGAEIQISDFRIEAEAG